MIKVRSLKKDIKGKNILEDINVDFEYGKIYGLVGKNGSGKTMLLRSIAGLIRPTEGSIHVDDKILHKDISFPPEMGIIIEKPELLNHLTGYENLKLLAEIKNVISDEQIKEYMTRFGLEADSKKTLKKYSLGMKQKIGIIQAVMENPKILLLDEPFNALDEGTVEMTRELLLQYKRENKLIIIASHNKEDLDILCDDLIYIEEGKLK